MSIRFHHESKIKEIINEWHTRNRFFSRCLSDLLVISWRWHTFDANRSQCSHISDSVWIFQVWAWTENGLTRIKAILDGTASEKCEMTQILRLIVDDEKYPKRISFEIENWTEFLWIFFGRFEYSRKHHTSCDDSHQ